MVRIWYFVKPKTTHEDMISSPFESTDKNYAWAYVKKNMQPELTTRVKPSSMSAGRLVLAKSKKVKQKYLLVEFLPGLKRWRKNDHQVKRAVIVWKNSCFVPKYCILAR